MMMRHREPVALSSSKIFHRFLSLSRLNAGVGLQGAAQTEIVRELGPISTLRACAAGAGERECRAAIRMFVLSQR
jgi:hypothetical protein